MGSTEFKQYMNKKTNFITGPLLLLGFVILLAFLFSNVEIQIEGDKGWAGGLPTWRIENHPLLDIFWGGRPMTGYHVWIFSFIAFFFHLPVFMMNAWNIKLEARITGCIMIFWIVEDFLWFIMNPAFGIQKFSPDFIPWHKKWLGMFPQDYVVFMIFGLILFFFSYRKRD